MRRQISEAQALWAIIAVMIGVDVLWAWRLGISVSPPNLWLVAGFCGMACINLMYTSVRPNQVIAAFAGSFAQLLAFCSAGTLLTYLAATSSFPLIDPY